MKKKFAFILALVMICSVFAFAGCGKSSSDTKTTTSSTKNDDNTLIVGFDPEFPPYGYRKSDGSYTGFDLELAKEVCSRRGWKFVAQPIDWDSKDMELKSGTIDCIWNGFTINGREDEYTWSDPYVNNTQVVVVKSDSGITKLSDLAGKTVAVQTDSSAQSCLEDSQKELAATFGSLDVEKDYNTCFMNLQSGAVDAIAMDEGVADYQITTRNDATYVKLDETLSAEKYGIGFKKGNTTLRDEVQETLDEMMADGTFQKIAKKYSDYGLDKNIIVKDSSTTTTTAAK